MIVRCSNCETRYLVDPAALGETGRRVRCTNCGHVWHQTPVADAPEANGPPPRRRCRWIARRHGQPGLRPSLFVIAALAGLALARNAIVTSWPGTVGIYDAVGLPIQAPQAQGLRIVDVQSERVKDGDRIILLVRGVVENTTEKGRRLPPLRAVLADEAGAALHQWPVAALSRALDSGQSTTLRELARRTRRRGRREVSVGFVADGGLARIKVM